MTIKISTALQNKLLDGGSGGGIKGGLNLCFCNIYAGSQPATANDVATGTYLGKISIGGLGVTGLTWDAAAAGVISKAAAEAWRVTWEAAGIAGWFRFYVAGQNPATADPTLARLDGACGTSGADLNLTNITAVVARVDTVDGFAFTMPSGV